MSHLFTAVLLVPVVLEVGRSLCKVNFTGHDGTREYIESAIHSPFTPHTMFVSASSEPSSRCSSHDARGYIERESHILVDVVLVNA